MSIYYILGFLTNGAFVLFVTLIIIDLKKKNKKLEKDNWKYVCKNDDLTFENIKLKYIISCYRSATQIMYESEKNK